MRRRDVLAILGAAPVIPARSRAQEPWPSRTITMVVPFPPGGQADLAARPVAQALSKLLGQSVIVENLGGAGGTVGNAAVARAAPDGYRLLMTLSSLAVLPEADRLFDRPPAYEASQLEPLARVLADPTVLAVPAGAPWRSFADFVAATRERPGTIPYGSSGPYGTLHIAMEMLALSAGIRLLHVPYRGAGPAVTGLLSGQIQALASAPGVLKAHVEAGTLRILGNWGAERIPAFPDVPTFRELGFRDVEFYIWAGVFAPKDLPSSVLARLHMVLAEAMRDADVVRTFEAAGSPPAYQDAATFTRFVAADSARLIATTRAIGKVG